MSRRGLRELVDYSAHTGALDAERRDQLLTALEVDAMPLRELVRPRAGLSGVRPGASTADIRAESRRSGHLRLLVTDPGERPVGVVHCATR